MRGLFTDGFERVDRDAAKPKGPTLASVLYRTYAPEPEPVTAPAEVKSELVEARSIADVRLGKMGRSESPEKEARTLDSMVRRVERKIMIDGVLDRVINNAPDKGK